MTESINWIAILVPVICQILLFVYFLGIIRAQIDGLGGRIEKLEKDFDKEHSANTRIDDRVHEIAISQAKIETLLSEVRLRVDTLCLDAGCSPLRKLRHPKEDGHE